MVVDSEHPLFLLLQTKSTAGRVNSEFPDLDFRCTFQRLLSLQFHPMPSRDANRLLTFLNYFCSFEEIVPLLRRSVFTTVHACLVVPLRHCWKYDLEMERWKTNELCETVAVNRIRHNILSFHVSCENDCQQDFFAFDGRSKRWDLRYTKTTST